MIRFIRAAYFVMGKNTFDIFLYLLIIIILVLLLIIIVFSLQLTLFKVLIFVILQYSYFINALLLLPQDLIISSAVIVEVSLLPDLAFLFYFSSQLLFDLFDFKHLQFFSFLTQLFKRL
jgi:hypothetical protein